MKVVVAGASGFIGTPLLAALRNDGHEVLQLVRREPEGPAQARWDPASGQIDPAAVEGVDAAVNLAGAGVGDHWWTAAYRQEILRSRIDTTTTLATALARTSPGPQVLVNASGIGYYGHRGDEVLTEDSSSGDTFLASVCMQWEAATRPASDAGVRVACLRTGLVMAPEGGAFGSLLPLFRAGLGGRLGSGRMWWSWITLKDQIDAIRFVLNGDVEGPVNLTGPEPVRNAEVTRALATALHRPARLAVPKAALKVRLGPFADEVTASQRVVPRKLLAAGFRFRHRTVDEAAAWVCGREAGVLSE